MLPTIYLDPFTYRFVFDIDVLFPFHLIILLDSCVICKWYFSMRENILFSYGILNNYFTKTEKGLYSLINYAAPHYYNYISNPLFRNERKTKSSGESKKKNIKWQRGANLWADEVSGRIVTILVMKYERKPIISCNSQILDGHIILFYMRIFHVKVTKRYRIYSIKYFHWLIK